METYKQNPDFLNIGRKLLDWYSVYGRDLPFRKTKNPYKIWICEVVFQQTRIAQGMSHYLNFIERFPDIKSLADASTDDVLLHWKGLGYYSRAMNIHKAAKQIVEEFNGEFPSEYRDILKLKGIGKYTAAAVSSICFGGDYPAIDGNFYRVISRLFADDYDISKSTAFQYFSEISMKIIPENRTGDFNQAMMDLGSEICKPKNPVCIICPVNEDCLAFSTGKTNLFPVKNKKTEVKDLSLTYYFVSFEDKFLIRRRGTDFIWKNLYEFPVSVPEDWEQYIAKHTNVKHKLTHRNLNIDIYTVNLPHQNLFEDFASEGGFIISSFEESQSKSFPKPLENYIKHSAVGEASFH